MKHQQQLEEINQKIRVLSKSIWNLKLQVVQLEGFLRDLRLAVVKYEGEKLK